MSAKLTGQVWDVKLEHRLKWVLMAMADHADHEGNNVFPSVALISRKTDYSERQVQRIIKDLRALKVLVAVAPANRYRPVEYRIDLSVLAHKAPQPFATTARGDILTPLPAAGVTSGAVRGDISAISGVTSKVSPESITEPSLESKEEGRQNGARPARPTADLALSTAKTFLSEEARSLARAAAEKFRWPRTGYRLQREARLFQQLLDVGFTASHLRTEIERRKKLATVEWLHRDLDVAGIERIQEDVQRTAEVQRTIERFWPKPGQGLIMNRRG